jgi:hypothetical protein
VGALKGVVLGADVDLQPVIVRGGVDDQGAGAGSDVEDDAALVGRGRHRRMLVSAVVLGVRTGVGHDQLL